MIARIWHALVWVGIRTYLWLNPTVQERVRGCVIHKGHVLLVKHVGGRNHWTLLGGGRHRSESWPVALGREIAEETDLEVTVREELLQHTFRRYGSLTVYHCYLCQAETTTLRTDRWELREAAWWPLHDLPKEVSPVVERALEQLNKDPGPY